MPKNPPNAAADEVIEDDDFEQEQPAPAQKTPPKDSPSAKPRFPAPMIREARALGISEADIEDCASSSELRDMIAVVESAESRRSRKETEAKANKEVEPPPPEPDPEWAFDNDLSSYDDTIVKELKKLGNAIVKAQKKGDESRVEELQKKLDDANERLARIERREHPMVRRAKLAVAKYKAIFGEEFDEDGRPPEGSEASVRFDAMNKYLFTPDANGNIRADLDRPEESIAKAVKALFGFSLEEPGKKPSANGKISDWAQAGQAPPTGRNGKDRSGRPSNELETKKKVAGKLKSLGLPTDSDLGIVDDDDDDI